MDSGSARIVTVLGTRPEIIKCSPLLPRFDAAFEHVLVHTGQHYDDSMDDLFFRELDLRGPDYNLAVGSGAHGAQLARMLTGIEPIMQEFEPDLVFVQGDTNSTLAGALAAAKLGLPVIHLEAGCRSFNRAMPEEINRVVVDHLAALCLAPDEAARANLLRERIDPGIVHLVGSTGVDACLRISERVVSKPSDSGDNLRERGYLLATIHRAENTSVEVLAGLLDALAELARDQPVVFPVHPRTARTLDAIGRRPGITYLEPIGYPHMMRLVRCCRALLTDSGGLQEEAAVLGAPTFVLRNETEWTEFVDAGRHRLVGTNPEAIVREVRAALDNGEGEARMRRPVGLERAGAADAVMRVLTEFLAIDREEPEWNLPALALHGGLRGDARQIERRAHEKAARR